MNYFTLTLLLAEALEQDRTGNIIAGLIGAICGSLPFLIRELFGMRKNAAGVHLTDAQQRQTDATTIRELGTDLQKAIDRYRGIGDEIRAVEETSDRRYRKLRNYVLDVKDVFDDLIPLLANVEHSARVVDGMKTLQTRANRDLETERQIYEQERSATEHVGS